MVFQNKKGTHSSRSDWEQTPSVIPSEYLSAFPQKKESEMSLSVGLLTFGISEPSTITRDYG